jgi:hypothetical protein
VVGIDLGARYGRGEVDKAAGTFSRGRAGMRHDLLPGGRYDIMGFSLVTVFTAAFALTRMGDPPDATYRP